MRTITLPPDIEGQLVREARKRGTTPELLALESLRRVLTHAKASAEQPEAETLFEFLSGYIGTVSGTTEALSENCGRVFADGMLEKQQRGQL
ncbi:MAG: hypothetical protein FJ279_13635 [Planctomycetes bacterium]|nr:hypothetical protein [Planctomycetota bacterium]MBM4082471.1 hypothetical protein [Planctomycetota bacterium]MBM4085152.1 hypothetical protein [Planctomycetota bacterium]